MRKILLTLLGALTALPLFARDFEYTYEGQTITYTVIDENAKTVKTKQGNRDFINGNHSSGNNISGALVLPSNPKDGNVEYTLSSISDYAFASCNSLTSITIPESVTSIGTYAFQNCSSLTSVTIPNSVTSIGYGAFYSCSGLTSVTIGNSVTSISDYAFYDCTGLTSVTIPESVTSIDAYAFYYCKGLKKAEFASIEALCKINFGNSYANPLYYTKHLYIDGSEITNVVIPESVTSIGSYAFSGCSDLTSVIIGNSVKSIGESAFSGCSGLKKCAYPNNLSNPFNIVATFIAYNPEGAIIEDGFIWGPDKSAIYFAPLSLQGEFVLPESVTSIGSSAFSGCSGLAAVTIPNSVTSIGSSAFSGCTGLTSVIIPESVTSIDWDAFYGCSSVTEVIYNAKNCKLSHSIFPTTIKTLTLGDNIVVIPSYLAYNCSSLTSIIIPESVTSIGDAAFKGCTGLTSVVSLTATPPAMSVNSFEGLYDKAEAVVPDNSLNSYLLSNWALFDNLKTAGGVAATAFSDDVFKYRVNGENSAMLIAGNYENMTSVSIPERVVFNDKFHYVTYIGDGAFKDCKNITALVLPKRLAEIGVSAFEGAKISVSDLSFPTTLTKIHDSAFKQCIGFSNVILPENLTYLGASAFSNCTTLKSIKLSQRLEGINSSAFEGCRDLTSITIPESVTSIGDAAFKGCTGLTSVTIGNSVESIGNYAFSYCSGLTSVTIPNSVTSIGEYAFRSCSGLTSLTLGNSVESIGASAFYECSRLTSVTIPNSVESIGASAFEDCTRLTSVTIPNSVESIGESAFNGCSALEAVTIPNSVESIGASAFRYCSKLTDVTIEEGASAIELDKTSLGSAVTKLYMGRDWNVSLNSLSKLQSLTLGNTVTTISDGAFSGCSNLTSVKFGSSVETIGADAFNGCKLTELVLSPATQTIGANAFKGNSLKTIALGANVKEIGGYAFDGSNALTGVSITALTPPAAENTTFSYYDCPLYVSPSANDAVKDAYYNFTRCWYRFNGYDLITINEVKVSGASTVNLAPGESVKLTATFTPANASLPYIFWRSTNPAIATVDKDGNVTMVANGGANTRAAEVQTCQIIAETLYANGPVASVTISSDGSFVEDIYEDSSISSARSNDIYTLQGVCVKRNATEEDVKALTPGLYIVGGKKILVK